MEESCPPGKTKPVNAANAATVFEMNEFLHFDEGSYLFFCESIDPSEMDLDSPGMAEILLLNLFPGVICRLTFQQFDLHKCIYFLF